MKLPLNIDMTKAPITSQDIEILKHIWKCAAKSNGFDAIIKVNTIPKSLKGKYTYKHLHDRLFYYRDDEQIIEDFEERSEGDEYYIVLSDWFVDAVNSYIKDGFPKYKLLEYYTSK